MTTLQALTAPAGEPLLVQALVGWLPQQRWYAGNLRQLERVHVHDLALIEADEGALLIVLIDVRYGDGHEDRYHVPLAVVSEDARADAVVARFEEGNLVDAMAMPWACRLLARLGLQGGTHATVNGKAIVATPSRAPSQLPLRADGLRTGADFAHGWVRTLHGEQSNSSVVIDEAAVLKLYRRLEVGVNPDIELPLVLAEAGVNTSAIPYGMVALQGRSVTVLASLSELIADAPDGWELALREVEMLAGGGARPPPGLMELSTSLGATVAHTHQAFAKLLGSHQADRDVRVRWSQRMQAQCERVLVLASRHSGTLAAPVVARRAEITRAFAGLPELDDAGFTIRVHGDLHLGQVLYGSDGWRLLDFEGEPARSLAERRETHSPLKDVAGMLRSFEYAAAQVPDSRRVSGWLHDIRNRFLTGYNAVAKGLGPRSATSTAHLLSLWELDKAVYELGYELTHRPKWVRVPVQGILQTLDHLGSEH